jgi:hypothetical protein
MDPEDAMLAGIVVENHQPLLTRNRKHFWGKLTLGSKATSFSPSPCIGVNSSRLSAGASFTHVKLRLISSVFGTRSGLLPATAECRP